jgi:two-component system chemotaxis response regulator CheY
MFAANTRILVIDDMLTMRKIVSRVCREIGFTEIEEATDGEHAWSLISASPNPPGLILSDWNMPKMSGLDLLKKIRGDARLKDVPFLLVTAEAEKTQVQEALSAGVDNYVVKPFSPQILKEKLAAVYQKRSAP